MPAIAPTVQTRAAGYSDATAIIAMDDALRHKQARANFIHQSITSRSCHVAAVGPQVVGYAILQYTFFTHGYISMLTVHRDHRRRGVGAWLIQHLEQTCKTGRLFIAVDQSNFPAKAFLTKLGYTASGTIENLDEPEPQALFFKRLR
jgi:ribosomal protein S18 acetylase RimI-like enzyme